MPLIRILVDGYSILHVWEAIAPGKPRFSAAARDELIHQLTHYSDATGIPITVVFDAAQAPSGIPKPASNKSMEVLFSKKGQTADAMIERATQRLLEYGDVLVVTDDLAERDLVLALGATTSSCAHFIQTLESTLHQLEDDVARHNQIERRRFRKSKT